VREDWVWRNGRSLRSEIGVVEGRETEDLPVETLEWKEKGKKFMEKVVAGAWC